MLIVDKMLITASNYQHMHYNIVKANPIEYGFDLVKDDQQLYQMANMFLGQSMVAPRSVHPFDTVFKRFFVPNPRARYPINSKRDSDDKGNQVQPGLEADIWM